MRKLPLQPAHLHRNRSVASGLHFFPHLLELHSSSVPGEPDCHARALLPRLVRSSAHGRPHSFSIAATISAQLTTPKRPAAAGSIVEPGDGTAMGRSIRGVLSSRAG